MYPSQSYKKKKKKGDVLRGMRFHSGVDEDSMFLGCDALSVGKKLPTFRKISVPSSSESFR